MTDATMDAEKADTGGSAAAAPELMGWDSRARRVVMLYVPLACFVLILLFPFYWMTVTAFKPNAELYDYQKYNPFLIGSPTLEHIRYLLFNTAYPRWLFTTMTVAIASTFLSLLASTLAAYAIQRLRFRGSQYVGLGIYLAYLVPPSILFIPLATMVVKLGLFDTPFALILTFPTFLVPFCTWLLIGYFKSIPYELEECALIDGATRLQILRKITLPLAIPGLISAGIFSFTLSWNEFIYSLAFIQSSEKKTVPVAILTELVTGDVYQWGALMAGSLLGSLPVAIFYSFFVDYYVSSLTGAVKE
jgi:multiple sugar transport system permease protein